MNYTLICTLYLYGLRTIVQHLISQDQGVFYSKMAIMQLVYNDKIGVKLTTLVATREEKLQEELNINGANLENRPVSPFEEMGAYEYLWIQPKTTFKSLSNKFDQFPGSVPSDFVTDKKEVYKFSEMVRNRFAQSNVEFFGVHVHGVGEYPQQLRDAKYPVALLYYRGWWDLTASRSIAVIGTRKPTRDGLTRTKQVVRQLVNDKFTVVSGLASGIDTMAHKSAIEENGNTIAVIGTPLSYAYPKENSRLQNHLAT